MYWKYVNIKNTMSYRNSNSFKENKKEIQNYSNIKSLLKEKNLNPKEINDLKYLLSLTINPDLKRFNLFKMDCLLIFLLKYLSSNTLSIFTEFFFQSCELGSLNIVRILLENDLDINSQNNLGETPLHIAVAKNDIELIKLLIEYNPKTNIATYKDGLTVMNYAEIGRNKIIYKIIKELNEKNIKEEIKNEIKDYINIDMDNIIMNNDNNKDTSSSLFCKTDRFNYNYEQIQNFNGEKISIITDSDINSSLLNNNLNKNNASNYENKCINTQQTIINESDYNEETTPTKKNKFLYPRNKQRIQNINILNINNSSNKKNNKEIKFFSSSFKKKSITNNLSLNPSYIQSLTTCHTSIKYSKIYEFINEINLPKEYAFNLIDNGFDNLEMLISQTKNGIALTYENLREIGIKKPGERIKILIHLEEISENFKFLFPKIIYNNDNNDNIDIKNKSNTLKFFLEKIGKKNFFINFYENGINNIELLFIQMASKQPLNENILINDLNIKKQDANVIIIKLYEYSRNYINKLKMLNKRNNNNENIINNNSTITHEEENNIIKSCDCILF